MTSVVLLPDDLQRRGAYLGTTRLPSKYMEDFSLMGFVVDNYEQACALLKSADYDLEKGDFGAEIIIASPRQLLDIKALFMSNRIHCEYSDIADTLYQA